MQSISNAEASQDATRARVGGAERLEPPVGTHTTLQWGRACRSLITISYGRRWNARFEFWRREWPSRQNGALLTTGGATMSFLLCHVHGRRAPMVRPVHDWTHRNPAAHLPATSPRSSHHSRVS
eukprot:5911768-Prymnesium_polylepis.2